MDQRNDIDEALDEALDRVERGERVTLHRRGEPIARLIPIDRTFDRDEVLRVKDRVARIREGVSMGVLRLKDMTHEGHKY